MPTLSGVPGGPSPRNTERTSGSGLAFSAKRSRNGRPVARERRLDAPSVLGEARPVVDEQRRAVLTGQRLRVRTRDPQPPVVVDVEAGAHPPWCGGGRAGRLGPAGHARTRGRVRACPLPGVQRFGPSSTGTPIASTQVTRRVRDLSDRGLERLLVAGARLAIAAELADVLAGGGLQFARRRRFARATEGLDASAHAATVRRLRGMCQPSRPARRRFRPCRRTTTRPDLVPLRTTTMSPSGYCKVAVGERPLCSDPHLWRAPSTNARCSLTSLGETALLFDPPPVD